MGKVVPHRRNLGNLKLLAIRNTAHLSNFKRKKKNSKESKNQDPYSKKKNSFAHTS